MTHTFSLVGHRCNLTKKAVRFTIRGIRRNYGGFHEMFGCTYDSSAHQRITLLRATS